MKYKIVKQIVNFLIAGIITPAGSIDQNLPI